MSLATLADVLQPALRDGYAVPGFVCLGWEDTRAYAMAAQAEHAPVILQVGPGARAHTPLPVMGAMIRSLAADVDMPVVALLDHGYTLDECKAAIDAGFSSVMYDGSAKPLAQNIAETAEVVELAHTAGVSCEGEVGFVGYADGERSQGTDPQEARRFAVETGVDALAVSVGNVHLQTHASEGLNLPQVNAIGGEVHVPLVIHGGSGVPHAQRRALARETAICKFNIGTELRQVFGHALRKALADDPAAFDRIKVLAQVEDPIKRAAQSVLRDLGASGRG